MPRIPAISFIISLAILTVCLVSPVCASPSPSDRETEDLDFANGLFSRGMYDLATEAYEDFLEKYPESDYSQTARYRIAEGYFLSGEYDKALSRFDTLLDSGPSPEMYTKIELRRGQIYLDQGKYPDAKRVFSTLSESSREPEVSASADYYLGMTYSKQGDYTTARGIFERIASSPGSGEYAAFAYMSLGDIYTELGNPAKAADIYGKAVSTAGEEDRMTTEAALRAGNAYYISGDYTSAVSFYEQVLSGQRSDETFNKAALGLVSALYKGGDIPSVARYTELYLPRIKDENVKVQMRLILGNAYFAGDHFDKAREIYGLAYGDSPGTVYGMKAKLNEAWALYKTGDTREAIDSVDTYLEETDMSEDEALYIKARALSDLGNDSQALDIYRRILDEFPDSGLRRDVLYETGWIYDGMGRGEEAAKVFSDFVAEYPEDERSPELFLKTAQENFDMGRYDVAEEQYMDFMDSFPESSLKENALYQLGITYLERGKYDEAAATLEKFTEQFPASEGADSAVYLAGEAYQKKEQWKEAIARYEKLMTRADGEFYNASKEATAYCYFQMGDYDRSAEIYHTLITGPEGYKLPEGVYMWLADHLLAKGEGYKSLMVLEDLVKKYPEISSSGRVAYMFGENYMRLGDTRAATEYFQKAIDEGVSSPYLERSYLGLGRACRAAGDNRQAKIFLEEALSGQKDNRTGALARMEMGKVNLETEEYEEAAKQFMMVAILYDDEELCAQALSMAGTSFEKAGDPEKAAEAFKELVDRYPDNPLSKEASDKIKRDHK